MDSMEELRQAISLAGDVSTQVVLIFSLIVLWKAHREVIAEWREDRRRTVEYLSAIVDLFVGRCAEPPDEHTPES